MNKHISELWVEVNDGIQANVALISEVSKARAVFAQSGDTKSAHNLQKQYESLHKELNQLSAKHSILANHAINYISPDAAMIDLDKLDASIDTESSS